MLIGNNLKTARKKAGLTQVDVAITLNITERQYQRYEADTYEPDLCKLCALADLFGVTTDYLLGRCDGNDA